MLTSELAGSVQESIELARQGEGIRIAFERLGRGDLLDSLRQATHGTITDLELMKAAVRFDDFKLPLDQLGTMLAFAQQKAKDTGQSFDYMVDSIVTGLGRQSPKILDNLGLSITEIHQKTKETGDMTKAVGEIIREQMEKAGDYVETAADRAARATVDTKNKMEEFGRSAAPVAEEFAQVWRALSIGAMDFANTLLGPVADSIRSLQNIWNNGWEDNIINSKFNLENGNYTPPKTGYQGMGKLQSVAAPGGYVEITDKNTGTVIGGRHFNNLSDKNSIKDWQKSLLKNSNKGGKGGKTEIQYADDSIMAQEKLVQQLTQQWKTASAEMKGGYLEQLNAAKAKLDEMVNGPDLDKLFPDLSSQKYYTGTVSRGDALMQSIRADMGRENMAVDQATLTSIMTMAIKEGLDTSEIDANGILERIFDGEDIPTDFWDGLMGRLNEALQDLGGEGYDLDEKGNLKQRQRQEEKPVRQDNATLKSLEKFNGDYSKVTGGVSSIVSGIQQMGVEIPQEIQSVLGVLTGISTIITGITSILSLILIANQVTATTSAVKSVPVIGWALARGGVVKAAGGTVAGTTYSGDQIPALLNAGEVVLNRAQVSNLASTLEGGGMQGMKLSATISGEQIRLVLNNNGRRTGKGEYVQTNSR